MGRTRIVGLALAVMIPIGMVQMAAPTGAGPGLADPGAPTGTLSGEAWDKILREVAEESGHGLSEGDLSTIMISLFETLQETPTWTEDAKLTASDAEVFDWFGYSVAVDGDTAVVGAYLEDQGASNAGAAYIYERDLGGPGNWGEVTKLTASDPAVDAYFGFSAAIDGDTLVVGSHRAMEGGVRVGAAYVFYRDLGGPSQWGEIAKITASDAEDIDEFGYSLAIDGDTLVVGARYEDQGGDFAGAAYIFERDLGGPDNWGEVAKLVASDAAAGDWFGAGVAIHGNTTVIGAPRASGDTGAAYVFDRDQGGPGNWGEVKKLTATGGQAGDGFGGSVSMDGDNLAVGALDLAYVFIRDQGGPGNWGEVKKLTTGVVDGFGNSVAISGENLVVGASFADFLEPETGAAYVFSRNLGGPDNWGEWMKLGASDGAEDDFFGRSVALNDGTAIVGAFGDDDACPTDPMCRSGSAYLFKLELIFTDGFESGDTGAWSSTVQ